MIILVLNCGSSSIKYQLLSMENGSSNNILAKGIVERIGQPEGILVHKPTDKTAFRQQQVYPDHTVGVDAILAALVDPTHGVISGINQIDAVGHRVAHGGEYFSESVLLDEQAKANIAKCSELAPLHNPAHLEGIAAIEKILPSVPQVAAFDTSFHQTIPEKAYFYAVPYELYEKYKVRRYGFHGTSHRFVAQKACAMTGLDFNTSKIITCHMGNGVSITAINGGKSVDTSMGFTPLEGLMMGTRSGDVDAGLITYLQDEKKMTPIEVSNLLNKESGLLGISGISSDMRDLWEASEKGNKRAQLAIDMFIYRVAKYIGAYTASMNGVDMVVYTGGIGENDWGVREGVSNYLGYLGAELDCAANDKERNDKILNTPASKIKLVMASTDEELVIATDTMHIVQKIKEKK